MTVTSLTSLLVGLLALGANVLVTVLLVAWGRRVAKKHGGGWWAQLAWAPVLGAAAQVLGFLVTVGVLVHSFDSVGAAPPQARAGELAASIDRAMLATAAGTAVGGAAYLAALVTCVVGTVRAPRGPLAGRDDPGLCAGR